MRSAALSKHSVRIAGHATSVSLEPAFWEVHKERILAGHVHEARRHERLDRHAGDIDRTGDAL